MIVLILTSVPASTKGFASRYLIEITAGTFVGILNKRVRDSLWEYLSANLGVEGKALLVYNDNSPQGYSMLMKNFSNRKVIDFDGVSLIQYSNQLDKENSKKSGWSNASRYKKRK